MNAVERQTGTRNATILMILAGALQIHAGYSFLQLAIIMTIPLHTLFGAIMICFGFLSFCTSLVIWFQNSRAMELITGVGIAVCLTLFIFGFFTIIVLFAGLYYIARNQLRQEIEYTEWFDPQVEN